MNGETYIMRCMRFGDDIGLCPQRGQERTSCLQCQFTAFERRDPIPPEEKKEDEQEQQVTEEKKDEN